MRLFIYIKKFIFRGFHIKISLFIFKKMLFYYIKIINYNLKSYIK